MADEKFTKADLQYIYKNVLGHEGRSKKDVDKIAKQLPATFTLADLQKVTTKGVSDTAWSQALSYIQNAVQQAPTMPQPTTVNTTPTIGNTGINPYAVSGPLAGVGRFGAGQLSQATSPIGGPSGATSATPVGPQDVLSQYMPGRGLASDALLGRFLGGPGGFVSPPTYAENYMQNRLSSFQPTGPSPLEQYLAMQAARGPTPPSGVEQFLAGQTARGPTLPSGLEQLLGGYAARGPQGLTPQASQFEQMLGMMAQNPFLESMARGEIPPAMQQALNANLALSRAGTIESQNMGGALASSDLAEGLARAENDARLNFLASMQGQAQNAAGLLGNLAGTGGGLAGQRMGIGASLFPALTGQGIGAEQARQGLDLQRLLGGSGQLLNAAQARQGLDLQRGLGFGSQLLGAEQNRRATDINRDLGFATPLLQQQGNVSENALNRYFGLGGALAGADDAARQNALNFAYQDYLRGLGLPPEVAALLGLAGLGGGTTKTTGTVSQSGGMGQDLLGAAGTLGGLGLMGGFGGFGGMFGGGGSSPVSSFFPAGGSQAVTNFGFGF